MCPRLRCDASVAPSVPFRNNFGFWVSQISVQRLLPELPLRDYDNPTLA